MTGSGSACAALAMRPFVAESGDAYVAILVRTDPRFVRDGDDLHTSHASR